MICIKPAFLSFEPHQVQMLKHI